MLVRVFNLVLHWAQVSLPTHGAVRCQRQAAPSTGLCAAVPVPGVGAAVGLAALADQLDDARGDAGLAGPDRLHDSAHAQHVSHTQRSRGRGAASRQLRCAVRDQQSVRSQRVRHVGRMCRSSVSGEGERDAFVSIRVSNVKTMTQNHCRLCLFGVH